MRWDYTTHLPATDYNLNHLWLHTASQVFRFGVLRFEMNMLGLMQCNRLLCIYSSALTTVMPCCTLFRKHSQPCSWGKPRQLIYSSAPEITQQLVTATALARQPDRQSQTVTDSHRQISREGDIGLHDPMFGIAGGQRRSIWRRISCWLYTWTISWHWRDNRPNPPDCSSQS